MSDLIELLSQFNRKERFFLIGQALGNKDFSLSKSFRKDLSDKIGIEIPHGAFAAMDYHLDWIAASLRAYQEGDPIDRPFPNSDQVVKGTQQDTDLLIAFKAGEIYHLVLLEAKGYSPWDNKQMREKAQRLKKLFGQDGRKHQPDVKPHFCLMSSRTSERLESDCWPAWMKDHWLTLNLDYPRLEVTLCDFKGKSLAKGDHFCIKKVQRPLERGSPVGPRQRLTRKSFLDEFTSDEARNAAAQLLDVAQESGSTFGWGPSGVSIRGRCSLWPQPISVAWLYPPSKTGMGWMKTREFSFGVAILDYDPSPEEELRAVLQKWVDGFRDDAFTIDASSKRVTARSVPYDAAAQHIDLLVDRLSKVLSELNRL